MATFFKTLSIRSENVWVFKFLTVAIVVHLDKLGMMDYGYFLMVTWSS